FLLAGAIGAGTVLIAVGLLRHNKNDRSPSEGSFVNQDKILFGLGSVVRLPNFRPAVFASIAAVTSSDLLIAYLPAYGEYVGLSTSTVGFLLSTRFTTAMISRLLLSQFYRITDARYLLA